MDNWQSLAPEQKFERLVGSVNFLALQNEDKNQMIKSLEKEVAQLNAELAALKESRTQ